VKVARTVRGETVVTHVSGGSRLHFLVGWPSARVTLLSTTTLYAGKAKWLDNYSRFKCFRSTVTLSNVSVLALVAIHIGNARSPQRTEGKHAVSAPTECQVNWPLRTVGQPQKRGSAFCK